MTSTRIAKIGPYEKSLQRHRSRTEALPVDVAVERLPSVVRLRTRMLRLERKAQSAHPDRDLFRRYADACSALAAARGEGYFDEGHQRGQVAGSLHSRRLSAEGRALAQRIADVVLDAKVRRTAAVTALLESARALVIGAKSFRRSGNRSRRR